MTDGSTWDERYAAPDMIHGEEPLEYLRVNASLLPRAGLALDLAAGEGRNAVFLAGLGLDVVGLDMSLAALRKCLSLARRRRVRVDVAAVDLTRYSIPRGRFEVVVNCNYLDRALAPQIVDGLKPGGVLVFETLTVRHLNWKPDFNRTFLLEQGELPQLFGSLHLLKYREADLRSHRGIRSVASLIAIKD